MKKGSRMAAGQSELGFAEHAEAFAQATEAFVKLAQSIDQPLQTVEEEISEEEMVVEITNACKQAIRESGLSREQVTGKERVVVVKNGDTYAGLLVDEVVQVVRIPLSSFEPAPAILEGIDRDFVSGIGRAGQQMVILLNVESITDINLS